MNYINGNLPTTILALDSKYAADVKDNGATAIFPISDGLESPSEFHSAMIQVLHFQAFNSIYNITEANNKLEIFIQKYNSTATAMDATGTSTVITIANGSYTTSGIVTALNTAILANCPAVLRGSNSSQANYYYYNGFGYSESISTEGDTLEPIVFDATTGFITFQIPTLSILSDSTTTGTYSSLTGIQGNTTFASNIYSGFYLLSNNYDGLLKTLGFILPGIQLPTATTKYGFGVYLVPTISSSVNTISVTYALEPNWLSYMNNTTYPNILANGNLQPPCLIDLSYPRSLNIISNGIPTTNRSVTPNITFGNLFVNIPVNCNFGEIIYYEPQISFPIKVSRLNLNSFTISILDEHGQVVNFNGSNWQLVLGLNWVLDVGATGDENIYQGRNLLEPLFNSGYDPLEKKRRY